MPIKVKIIADSICSTRMTSFLVRCPRIILAEINTHKVLNRSSASSRAIPVMTRVQSVKDDPFIPLRMGANMRGMQAEAAMEAQQAENALFRWMESMKEAVHNATLLSGIGLHKGWANRVIETYAYVDLLITGTEFDNLFNLRVDEPVQDEFFELAGRMLLAMEQSKPKKLSHGQWHMPFTEYHPPEAKSFTTAALLSVSAARCARLSYSRHDGTFTVAGDLELSQGLLKDGHMGPFEHQGEAVDAYLTRKLFDGISFTDFSNHLKSQNAHWDGEDLWWGNLKWFKQYRKMIPGESRNTHTRQELMERFIRIRTERGYPALEPEVLEGLNLKLPNI
jgi:hypothetical protein